MCVPHYRNIDDIQETTILTKNKTCANIHLSHERSVGVSLEI